MNTQILKFCLVALCGAAALTSSGCLMQRTVKEGGQVISQEYVVETPIIDALKNKNN